MEYANSVAALLGVEVDEQQQPKEQIIRGNSQIAAAQKTGLSDLEQYYAVALSSAEQAADDVLATCERDDCSSWAEEWLELAWRGPVDASIRQPYLNLLDSEEAGSTQRERLVTFLTAALTSSRFLYRLELGSGGKNRAGAELRELDDYEIATRLSYLVWQGPPDRKLLDAAARGELSSDQGRLAALERMLDDDKKAAGLLGFATDWFGVFENELPKKNSELLAEADPKLPESARESFRRTVQELLVSPDAGWTDLLDADRFVVDPAVRDVLGLEPDEQGFLTATLPPQYSGMLTHPYVIAAHSKESGASPFPLGEFVYENILCEEIPPPPPIIDELEETEETADQTLRERLETLTKPPVCNNCHRRIGPPGFAFLTFDPIGNYSETDGLDRPFDTAGTLLFDQGQREVEFSDVTELADVFAGDPQVQACVSRRLFRFAYGRFAGNSDSQLLSRLSDSSRQNEAQVEELLRQLVSDSDFATVKVNP